LVKRSAEETALYALDELSDQNPRLQRAFRRRRGVGPY